MHLLLRSLQVLYSVSNSYTIGCPPVRGDNPRALAIGLSYVQVDNMVYFFITFMSVDLAHHKIFLLKLVRVV